MPIALEGARKSTPPAELVSTHDSGALLAQITAWLDDAKAENVVAIDIRGKSSIGDYMVIA
jgi:ribosome-associated protein